jgi:aldehyde:ferredoxin oxidoreductase
MDIWARILNGVSGTDYTSAEVEAIGARVHNLERLINLKLGFSKKDDTLPKRLLTEPLKEGLSKGRTVPLEEMLQEYYDYRGWDDQGIPTPATIERFQLKEDVPWL